MGWSATARARNLCRTPSGRPPGIWIWWPGWNSYSLCACPGQLFEYGSHQVAWPPRTRPPQQPRHTRNSSTAGAFAESRSRWPFGLGTRKRWTGLLRSLWRGLGLEKHEVSLWVDRIWINHCTWIVSLPESQNALLSVNYSAGLTDRFVLGLLAAMAQGFYLDLESDLQHIERLAQEPGYRAGQTPGQHVLPFLLTLWGHLIRWEWMQISWLISWHKFSSKFTKD